MAANIKDAISTEEWQTRVDLAALHRIAQHFGIVDLVVNHFYARVPGEPDHFLVKPKPLMFDEITASNLLKINFNGDILCDAPHGGYALGGFTIHTSVMEARPEITFTMHTHTNAGAALSAKESGLKFLSQYAIRFYNQVAYHDYEGLSHRGDERTRLIRDIGDKRVMILRNHGLLVAGRSIPEAFLLHHYLERACQVQLLAEQGGDALFEPSEEECLEISRHWPENKPESGVAGDTDWAALLRRMDRLDLSFRD
ncbi:MAG: class II aldolase/adducin family protein [Rhodospirillales bacterium]|jgi:ribulose-5-phosphate 4-epimerase/fuculose-1-phosphate aldolase